MLPTLGFIICAYGIYALLRAWSRRPTRRIRPYHRVPRRRLTLVGGAGLGAACLIFFAIVGLPTHSDNLRSASLISIGFGEDLLTAGQPSRPESFPLKNQGEPGQPIYAYLHPETPPAQLLKEKGPPPARSFPKPRRLGKPAPTGKALKTIARAPKKEKLPIKNRVVKKKKPNPTTGNLAANPG